MRYKNSPTKSSFTKPNTLTRLISSVAKLLIVMIVSCLTFSTAAATDQSYKLDFDGDGKADIAVFRSVLDVSYPPSYWYILNSQSNQASVVQWGQSTDKPAAADYDNDGKADIAIHRIFEPDGGGTGNYDVDDLWVNKSSGGYYIQNLPTHANTDLLGRNFVGGGAAETGSLRYIDVNEDIENPCVLPIFFINTGGSDFTVKYVGDTCNRGGIAAVGDYNNDGKSDVAIFRKDFSTPSNSQFSVWYSITTASYTAPDLSQNLDLDYPAPGDYDGDGKTDFAGYKYNNGAMIWRVKSSISGTVTDTTWGLPGDKPAPADYDGDGKTDICIFRPSTGDWWIFKSATSTVYTVHFGASEDIPIAMPNQYAY